MIFLNRKRNQISVKAKLWQEDIKDVKFFTEKASPEGILGKDWEGDQLKFLSNGVLVQDAGAKHYRLGGL